MSPAALEAPAADEAVIVILVGGADANRDELLQYARSHGWTPALTAPLAGAKHDRTPKAMRTILERQGVEQLPAKLDDRTPLYGLDDIDRAVATMPGQGARTDRRRGATPPESAPAPARTAPAGE